MKVITFCCYIFHQNKCTGRLEIVDGKLIKNEVYTDNIMEHPFPNSKTFMDISAILGGRVIPYCRWMPEYGEYLGVKEYNVYDILRKTHGVDYKDFLWFKFDEDPIDMKWEDVKVRG